MRTYYAYARLMPGTARLHEQGSYSTRALAEAAAIREMEADGQYGGVIIKNPANEEPSSVVSSAFVDNFEDFVDLSRVLELWAATTDEVRRAMIEGTVDLNKLGPSGMPAGAVLYGRTGHYGPYTPEYVPDFDRFLVCIKGCRLD
jgi:hypothetical protein